MSKLKESFILNVAFPLADKLMGTCVMKWYRQICKMNTWSRDEISNWQNTQLQAFVKHAYNHTVYYKRVFDELGLSPEDIKCAEDLKKLPVVTKDIANAHFEELVPDNLQQFKYRKSRTGGTTGEPMFYYCDENTWGYVTAAKIYYWTKTKFNYGDAFVALGSSSLFGKKSSLPRRIYDKMRNEIPMNCVNVTDEICLKYVDTIKKKNVRFLYGYAAAIYVFSKFVSDNNIDLHQIEQVFTTSENLPDHYREFIKKTFDCDVMDCYGAKDAGITAYEQGYHQYCVGYNVVAEIINPTSENSGALLTTNFVNYSFPLIRYQFGDEVALSNTSDKYNGQVITKVEGRTSDVMRLANGHNLTSTGMAMIMKNFDVKAFAFDKVDDNHVELRIEVDKKKYNQEQENMIKDTIVGYIGVDCILDIVYVDHFEPLKNGKRRYFMN